MNHAKYQWWLSVIAHYIGLSTMNQSIDELKDYVIAHYIGLSTKNFCFKYEERIRYCPLYRAVYR